MTLDDISGKGDSYDFRGSSEDWEIKEGRTNTGVAGRCHAGKQRVVQSKELSLKQHLKLMAGRMVELNVKGS